MNPLPPTHLLMYTLTFGNMHGLVEARKHQYKCTMFLPFKLAPAKHEKVMNVLVLKNTTD